MHDIAFFREWAIPFNICTPPPPIEGLGNLRGRGSLRVISEGAFMSVSLNSFFFPDGECVGALILTLWRGLEKLFLIGIDTKALI